MFLQELGNDFVLLLELRFQHFDFGDVGILLPFDIGRVWDTAQRLLRLFKFGLSFPFEYFSLQLLPHGGFLLFP